MGSRDAVGVVRPWFLVVHPFCRNCRLGAVPERDRPSEHHAVAAQALDCCSTTIRLRTQPRRPQHSTNPMHSVQKSKIAKEAPTLTRNFSSSTAMLRWAPELLRLTVSRFGFLPSNLRSARESSQAASAIAPRQGLPTSRTRLNSVFFGGASLGSWCNGGSFSSSEKVVDLCSHC